VEGEDLRVKHGDGDEDGGEGGLGGDGDDGGPAVAVADKAGGFDERFFEHGCTSMELSMCIQARNATAELDTGEGGSVPAGADER